MDRVKHYHFFLLQIALSVLMGWFVNKILFQLVVNLVDKILVIIPLYFLLLLFVIYASKNQKNGKKLLYYFTVGIGAISVAHTVVASFCFYFYYGNLLWYSFVLSITSILLLEFYFFRKTSIISP